MVSLSSGIPRFGDSSAREFMIEEVLESGVPAHPRVVIPTVVEHLTVDLGRPKRSGLRNTNCKECEQFCYL